MELSSFTKKLDQYYSQIPADEHIHIIVQMPSPPPAMEFSLFIWGYFITDRQFREYEGRFN
jgi:hypothetical protein